MEVDWFLVSSSSQYTLFIISLCHVIVFPHVKEVAAYCFSNCNNVRNKIHLGLLFIRHQLQKIQLMLQSNENRKKKKSQQSNRPRCKSKGPYSCCHLIFMYPFKWITLVLKVKESILLHFMPNSDSKFVKCLPETEGLVGCLATK